ncbi:MAG: hypothetical protein ABJC07_07680 [Acidobacteriota bacterium]
MLTASRRARLGEWLLGEGLVTQASLTRALAAQTRVGHRLRLGGVLLASGLVSEDVLLDALSRLHSCRAVGWKTLSQAEPEAVASLSAARAARLEAFPYAVEKTILKVAFRDPSNLQAVDEVAAVTGRRIEPAVTSEVRLMQAHEKFYSRAISGEFSNVLKRLDSRRVSIDVAPSQTRALPPPPQFSAIPEPETESPTREEVSSNEPLEDADAAQADPVVFPDDPFSDSYSLNDFLSDALAFGVMPETLPEPRWAGPDETSRSEIPLDLGEPLPDDDPSESTQPSLSRRPRPSQPLGIAR